MHSLGTGGVFLGVCAILVIQALEAYKVSDSELTVERLRYTRERINERLQSRKFCDERPVFGYSNVKMLRNVCSVEFLESLDRWTVSNMFMNILESVKSKTYDVDESSCTFNGGLR